MLAGAGDRQVVATTGANLFYVTDFFGGGIGIVRPDKTIVVTGVLESDRVKEIGKEVEVVKVKRRVDLEKVALKQLERGHVIIDREDMFRRYKRFTKKPELFLETRRLKDEEEINRIRRASRGLDRIFESLAEEIKPGRTEWEIGAEIMRTATLNEMTP